MVGIAIKYTLLNILKTQTTHVTEIFAPRRIQKSHSTFLQQMENTLEFAR